VWLHNRLPVIGTRLALLDLDLEPRNLGDSIRDSLMNIARRYDGRIDSDVVMPSVGWKVGKDERHTNKASAKVSAYR
jgi:hypothetical protein